MIDLFKGLKNHYSGSSLAALLSGGLHYGQAPDKTVAPYGVLYSPTALPADTFTADIDEVSVQYNLYSAQSSPVECFGLIDACLETFDNQEIVVWPATGLAVVLQRDLIVSPIRTGDDENAMWQGTVEFGCHHHRKNRY